MLHHDVMRRNYPKPGPIGGRLIREVVKFLRERGIALPIDSYILIAISGGADSVALGHLLANYGRRVVDKSRIKFVHINHGWRGRESDADSDFVQDLAQQWEIPIHRVKLPPLEIVPKGESLEEWGRNQRREIFEGMVRGGSARWVMTAHHSDDLAETMLWRLFTGQWETHQGGILARTHMELRPFLRLKKKELEDYLREEGQGWREDLSNLDQRYLRNRIRAQIMPSIESCFPRAVDHLVRLGLQAQKMETLTDLHGSGGSGGTPQRAQNEKNNSLNGPRYLFNILGLKGSKPRRSHWEALERLLGDAGSETREKELHLPGGWKLIHGGNGGGSKDSSQRWTIEKIDRPPEE